MVVQEQKKLSQSWWFHGHNNNQKTSPWLQSTLSELDEKTTAMLKLIEEDADSFAQRAEMYYKKRPELINMVEDFYRTHRSLAERFDLLKSEPKSRLITSLSAPIPFKYQPNKSPQNQEKCYDSYSEDAFESDMSAESEVDDPEQEEIALVHKRSEDLEEDFGESEVDEIEVNQVHKGEGVQILSVGISEEVKKLKEEIEKLKEENKIQQEQLKEKDEEKREVIRQLSLSMEILRDDLNRTKSKVTESSLKKKNPFEFNTFKELFSGKLFNGLSKSKVTTIVAL
ncbi:hypothetical protein C5167_003948 [Papaver somniferum]|uniref:protein NETWORKED 3A-like n=1 Tax=Papaver somniferum TaxID=3469 RepID=UPI000E6F6570|nr:protein NETWORKED 3A-like [Papaver somniferum]RZC94352.1 hypothetical protein C5167_003948 [Papaver somniferum]